ncbi:hypothetical protein Tco_0584124 [Tanacetum coccineum]
MEVESLSIKFPIVDWKTCVLTENFMYYQIFRGDGSSKNYKILSEMLEDFDRQDVEELYRLVKESMLVQASEEVGEDSIPPTDSTQIPIIDQPSTSSQPKKKQKSRRKQRKEAEVANDETEQEENIPTPSNDPLPSGEDSMQLNDLMVLCTQLQKQVLDLEKAKSDQAIEIASLKKRVDKLEKRRQLRTTGLKRFKKLGTARRVQSSNASLGAQEDASKQGRSIEDIDADAEVTLVNETQEQQNEDLMFDTGVLDDDEVFVDVTTSEKDEQSTKLDDSTAGEAVTTASVEDSAAPTIQVSTADIRGVIAAKIDELTLAQTLIEIKASKPKVVITTATTTTTTSPKARGVVVQEPSEFRTSSVAQPSMINRRRKATGSRKKSLGKKRGAKELQQESPKKQKLEDDEESDEHEQVKADYSDKLKRKVKRQGWPGGVKVGFREEVRRLRNRVVRSQVEVGGRTSRRSGPRLGLVGRGQWTEKRNPRKEVERGKERFSAGGESRGVVGFRTGIGDGGAISTVSMKLLLPVEVKTAQITTVSIKISTAGTYYCLCSVSAAGYKDTTAADLQLFEDLLLSRG